MTQQSVRQQATVFSTAGDRWQAWEIDFEGQTYYVQETGSGIDHVLVLVGEGISRGWACVEPAKAEQVIQSLLSIKEAASR